MGEYGREEKQQFLNHPFTDSEEEQQQPCTKKTGTARTAVAHIITAVIGSGALSLAWSVAQLGWIGGPLDILACALIIIVSARLLSDCYRSPHPQTGHIINHTYTDAVRFYLGERSVWICGIFQEISLFGTGIAYVITSANSIGQFENLRSGVQRSDSIPFRVHALIPNN